MDNKYFKIITDAIRQNNPIDFLKHEKIKLKNFPYTSRQSIRNDFVNKLKEKFQQIEKILPEIKDKITNHEMSKLIEEDIYNKNDLLTEYLKKINSILIFLDSDLIKNSKIFSQNLKLGVYFDKDKSSENKAKIEKFVNLDFTDKLPEIFANTKIPLEERIKLIKYLKKKIDKNSVAQLTTFKSILNPTAKIGAEWNPIYTEYDKEKKKFDQYQEYIDVCSNISEESQENSATNDMTEEFCNYDSKNECLKSNITLQKNNPEWRCLWKDNEKGIKKCMANTKPNTVTILKGYNNEKKIIDSNDQNLVIYRDFDDKLYCFMFSDLFSNLQKNNIKNPITNEDFNDEFIDSIKSIEVKNEEKEVMKESKEKKKKYPDLYKSIMDNINEKENTTFTAVISDNIEQLSETDCKILCRYCKKNISESGLRSVIYNSGGINPKIVNFCNTICIEEDNDWPKCKNIKVKTSKHIFAKKRKRIKKNKHKK